MKRLQIILALGLGGLILGSLFVFAPSQAKVTANSVQSEQTLTEPLSFDARQETLKPPDGELPAISSDKAVDAAESLFDPGTKLGYVQPKAALFSWVARPVDPETDDPIGPPYYTDVPVWAVAITGAPCFAYNGSDSVGPCPGDDVYVIVDGSSGKVILELNVTSLDSSPSQST